MTKMNQESYSRDKILVCSGGGAHTTSYIGFWKYVYDEHNFRPDCIIGASGGALFGCFMAAGISSREMENAIKKYKPWKHFRIAPFIWVADFLFYWGLVRIQKIQRLLKRIFDDYDINWNSFSETEFQCIVTDLNDGKRKYIQKDMNMELTTAITASIAIPGIFEPMWIKGEDGTKHCYVDGGVCEGYPIKAAMKKGRENVKIFAISPFDLKQKRSYTFKRKMQYARVLYRTLLDAKGEDMIDLLDKNLGDYYLPTGSESKSVLDFKWEKVKANINLGYKAAKDNSEVIKSFFEEP
jgi:predicted acylesterase/phospholipase RssA